MKALGAVFGSVYGWERPGWFAPPGYRLSEADLDRRDVLLNHNHAPPDERRQASARNGRSAARIISTMSAMSAATCTRMSACWTCRPSPSTRSRGRGPRTGWTRILANRIPKKIGRIALCHLLSQNGGVQLGIHRLSNRRGALLSRRRPAPSSAMTTTTLSKLLPATGGVQLAEDHHRRSAFSCWPARARASCCRSSPTPISPTPLSPGSRAAVHRCRHCRARMRSGSISSASSASSCITRSRCRTRSSILMMDAGESDRHQALRHQGDGFAPPRKILPAHPARAVDRICRARIRPRPLRPSEQGGRSSAATRWSAGERAFRTASSRWRSTRDDADPRGNEPIYDRRGPDRPLHLGRLWLARRQIARARHGPSRSRRARQRAQRAHTPGQAYPATVIPESPYDPREPEAQSLNPALADG